MPSLESTFQEEAYVLLHPTERISRSYRVCWYFDHLYKDVRVGNAVTRQDSLQVVSVVNSRGQQTEEIRLSPETRVWYLGENYSFVIAVDMNPSMAIAAGGAILLDDLYRMFEMCLESLVQPIKLPGLEQAIIPSLCVTVLACTNDCSRPTKQKNLHVVDEGVSVTYKNVKKVIAHFLKGLRALERFQQDSLRHTHLEGQGSQNMLESVLKSGILGVQLLPRTSIKGIVVLTNGVTGFNSSSSMHSTISEMRTNNISCWIFRAGSNNEMDWGFGQVPECETMSFVARACNGSVTFIREFFAESSPDKLKALQKDVLLMSFQKEADLASFRLGCDLTRRFIKMHREEYARSTIEGSLSSVLGCRIREGFLVSKLKCERDYLEINLCLALQTDIVVHYAIIMPWPVQTSSGMSISVSYEAPRAFVCEFTSDMPHQNYTPYRASAIKRLKQFLHNLRQADRLLGQLLTFSAASPSSKVPSRYKDGMPVFYQLPNQSSNSVVPSVSVSEDKDRTQDEASFVSFWKPVCTLDTIYWKKWMHGHKVNLVLSPDAYLPPQVLQPSPSGRFQTLQCRFSTTKLMDYLKRWSSFILLENHTFVKFLSKDDTPAHFCLVRVVQKLPTVVLHIGCLEGIAHSVLLQIIESLKAGIQGLLSQPAVKGSKARLEKPPLAVEAFQKPLQKEMVWYATLPKNLCLGNKKDDLQLNLQYLSLERRVWCLPDQVDKHDIADALLRKHFDEGFRISSCQNGMITLALQLTLKQQGSNQLYFALLQYVLFLNMEKIKDATILVSEIWVEPQYGEVVKPKLSLSAPGPYTTKDLPELLMQDEVATLSSIVTFHQLFRCCSTKSEPKKPLACLPCSDLHQVSVPLRISALFPHSRVVGLMLPAFSGVQDANLCSESANEFLRQNVHRFLGDMFDLYLTPKPIGASLLRKLEEGKLSKIMNFFPSFPTYWHVWLKKDEKDLHLALIPDSFSFTQGERESHVCVIILQCTQKDLLSSYPSEVRTRGKLPNMELVLGISDLKERQSDPPASPTTLQATIVRFLSNYVHSYLEAFYHSQTKEICLPISDIMASMELCRCVTVSVDCTQYLAQVCGHCVGEGEGITLLETPFGQEVGWCGGWSGCLQAQVGSIMKSCSMHAVKSCPGYYYLFVEPEQPGTASSPLEDESTDTTATSIVAALQGHTGEDGSIQKKRSDTGVISEMSSPEFNNIRSLFEDVDGVGSARGGGDAPEPPLFVHLTCSVRQLTTTEQDDRQLTASCDDCEPLLSCVGSILGSSSMDVAAGSSLQVNLHLNCLHLPPLRAVSVGNEDSFELSELPHKQRHLMLSLQSQIKWILEDEALSIPHLYRNLTMDTVDRLVVHASESIGNRNCYQEQLPISFVFGVQRCLERFVSELKSISVDNCQLSTMEEYLVLTLEKESFFQRPRDPPKLPKVPSHRRCHSYSGTVSPPVRSLAVGRQLQQALSSHSSAANLLEEDSKAGCGNLWLVLRVVLHSAQQHVQMYFQRRTSFNWPEEAIRMHSSVYESAKKEVYLANKRVNQWYLLKQLLDTRTCHSLLIPESESEAWVEGTLGGGEDGPDQIVRGYGCPCVWMHQFKPYWRLTLTQAKNMARSVLDAFAVVDRENVFVVSEIDPSDKDNEDIFYMRIFESMCGEDQAYASEVEETATEDERETLVSVMDSISSLSVLTGKEELSTPLTEDTQSILSHPTLVECLNVALYGIKQPSSKLTDYFKNIIQRKLDDSALEVLCSKYAYDSGLKLKPQDVSFIQPMNRPPDHRMVFPVPKQLEDYTQALAVYFLQLLDTFTIKPLYSPETQPFTGFPSDAFALYLRPRHQGRGLGLLAVSILGKDNSVVPFNPGVTSPASWETWSREDLSNLISSQSTPSSLSLSVSLWEHGNISLSDVEMKMVSVFHMAVLSAFLEIFVLPCPLSFYNSEDLLTPLASPRTPLPAFVDVESSLDFTTEYFSAMSPLPARSRQDTATIMEGVADAMQEGPQGSSERPVLQLQSSQPQSQVSQAKTWRDIELEKRQQQHLLEKQRLAESGKEGLLTEVYQRDVVDMLAALWSTGCPGVQHWSKNLPSQADKLSFLAAAESLMQEYCWEFCTRVYLFDPQKDCYRHVDDIEEENADYFVFGFCLRQWREARETSNPEVFSNSLWIDPKSKRPCQLFMPLDSKKISPQRNVPFQDIAASKHVFVPRQRLMFLSIKELKVEVYAYNLTDEIWHSCLNSLEKNVKWLNLRYGLLQHIALQKMGLFDHTDDKDMEIWTSNVSNFRHYISLATLFRNGVPPKRMGEQQESRDFLVYMEEVYRDAVVQTPVLANRNPVLRHGQQMASVAMSWVKADLRRKNLEKAFNAWTMKKSDSHAPMVGKTLAAVKELARAVHFCTTPILEPHLAECEFSERFFEEFKRSYIHYLEETLRFSLISESKGDKREVQKHRSVTFQRALHTGGVLLLEVACRLSCFTVQLYAIERSRAVPLASRKETLSASSHFTEECSQVQDAIHVHSFSYDQHIRFLHKFFTGVSPSPKDFDAMSFLHSFYSKNKVPPKYARTRLHHGVVEITDSEQSALLFQHVLTHPMTFKMHTLVLSDDVGEEVQLCLHCRLAPEDFFPSTEAKNEKTRSTSQHSALLSLDQATAVAPELDALSTGSGEGNTATTMLKLQNAPASKKVKVASIAKPKSSACDETASVSTPSTGTQPPPARTESSDSKSLDRETYAKFLSGMFAECSLDSVLVQSDGRIHHFVFVVHNTQRYPSESLSDIVADCYLPASDLGVAMQRLYQSIHTHIQRTLSSAKVHFQREDLWKKLLYGPECGLSVTVDPVKTLACAEMEQLLSMVQCVPLVEFDPRLAPLLNQKTKWYEVMSSLLTTKYQEDIRTCSNAQTSSSYTVVINPQWSDMLIVLHINSKDKHQFVNVAYRKPMGVAPGDPHPHIESEQSHIRSFVNFISSFIWANLVLHSKTA